MPPEGQGGLSPPRLTSFATRACRERYCRPGRHGRSAGLAVPLHVRGARSPSRPVDTTTTTADLELDPAPKSVVAARRFIRSTLSGWGLARLTDTVVFLANELVTNAVLHAPGPLSISLRRNGKRLRCEVLDRSPEQPEVRSYALDDLTGRGLALVVAMAAAWGVDSVATGKCVWFEVDI